MSTSTSSDKLAFDVGLQEQSEGEACWWTIHPSSKQRSEGEKVRVGDDAILVSVATERYLVNIHFPFILKFIHSEKATNFGEIFTLLLTGTT